MKLVPVPVDHVVPPFVLYCQAAPGSTPDTATVPTLVVPVGKLMLNAVGAVMSMVMAAVLAAAVLVLPAASVWRTLITPVA